MRPTNVENELSQLLHKEGLYENILKYICFMTVKFNLIEFFQNGPAFLDELFCSKIFKNLSPYKQIEILELLNKYKARYSDAVYIEALWYPEEIQKFVKKNLPREYSQRHIEDIEN